MYLITFCLADGLECNLAAALSQNTAATLFWRFKAVKHIGHRPESRKALIVKNFGVYVLLNATNM